LRTVRAIAHVSGHAAPTTRKETRARSSRDLDIDQAIRTAAKWCRLTTLESPALADTTIPNFSRQNIDQHRSPASLRVPSDFSVELTGTSRKTPGGTVLAQMSASAGELGLFHNITTRSGGQCSRPGLGLVLRNLQGPPQNVADARRLGAKSCVMPIFSQNSSDLCHYDVLSF